MLKRLLPLLLIACGAKPIDPEPEPATEYPYTPACASKLEAGMKVAAVEELCGAAYSAIYVPDFADATALRWCHAPPCHQMYTAAFIDGRLQFWGRAYEVVR
jgi:hypothetical protein